MSLLSPKRFFPTSALLVSALLTGCGTAGTSATDGPGGAGGNGTSASSSATTSGAGAAQPSALALYGPAIQKIIYEVDYADGAEPYTGPLSVTGDTWDLFEKNMTALFEGSQKTLVVPHTLDQMEKLTDVQGTDFTTDDILAIAQKHRTEKSTDSTAAIYAVWLPGYFEDKDGEHKDILGVSLWDTGVIAMFKPVITGAGGPGPLVAPYMEQSTLVHEAGHAAGLVNDGIAMVKDHQDTANGAHCSNKDCVMYYANEGASAMLQFAQNAIAKNNTTLFAQECLDDAHAATKAAASK